MAGVVEVVFGPGKEWKAASLGYGLRRVVGVRFVRDPRPGLLLFRFNGLVFYEEDFSYLVAKIIREIGAMKSG